MKFVIEKPKHLSPSTINSFIAYRSQWFMGKILGKRSPGNPAMFRGTSVEDGINYFIAHRSKADWGSNTVSPDIVDQSVKKAKATFAMKCAECDSNPDFLMPSIEKCVRKAIDHFVPIWKNTIPICQQAIQTMLDGVKTPVIGYLDYSMPGVIQDLKVSAKTPSKCQETGGYVLPQNYILQGAIYQHATSLPVEFHYCIPLKTATNIVIANLTDKDYEWGLAYATLAAQKIELIYDTLEKPWAFQTEQDIGEVFAAMAFPSMDAFWDEKERELAAKVWSIPIKGQVTMPYSMPEVPKDSPLNKIWAKKPEPKKPANPFFQT